MATIQEYFFKTTFQVSYLYKHDENVAITCVTLTD